MAVPGQGGRAGWEVRPGRPGRESTRPGQAAASSALNTQIELGYTVAVRLMYIIQAAMPSYVLKTYMKTLCLN